MKRSRGFVAGKNSVTARFKSFFEFRISLFMLIAGLFFIGSCCSLKRDMTLSDLKAKYECVEITPDLEWKTVKEVFEDTDAAPRPDDSLSENARVYCNKTVIFYIDLKNRQVEGRKTFSEVVTRVEVCKDK